MKQLWLRLSVILALSIPLFLPLKVAALETTSSLSLIINEIKIKNDSSGYNEFIELYNADVTSLNLNDFTIEYYNSPAPSDSDQPVKKSVIADGMLLPTQSIVLAANTQQITGSLSLPFSSLSDSGGKLIVKDLNGTVQDQVAWTSTSSLAISPVLFLSSNTSNKTKSFIRDVDDQGNPILTNSTWQLLTPTPHADDLLEVSKPAADPEPEQQTPPQNDTATDQQPNDASAQTETPAASTSLLPLQISELLPNPASPASDSTDEFIELYNPNDESVDLSSYKLQSGNTYSYSYTFVSSELGPHEYHAFYVSETNDLLANSGGRARLLDPSGQIVFETTPYDAADDGVSWAMINGNWNWTTTPTPNAENVLTLPIAKSSSSKTASSKSKTSAAKKTTAKAASAKSTKPKTSKSTSVTDDSDGNPASYISSVHPGIIAVVGILALGYGLYEYRHDVANRIFQLRRYRATRRATRTET